MLTENEIFLLQLHKLGSELIEGSDLKKSLRRVLETARRLLHFNRVYLFVKNQQEDLIEVLMAVGKYSFIAKSLKWPRRDMGGPTYVFEKGRSFIQHGLSDKRIKKYYPKKNSDYEVLLSIYTLGKFGEGDILLVPVVFRGRTIAVLGADKFDKKLTKSDLLHLEEFASQIGWAIENARLREENQAMLKNLENMVEKRTRELKELQSQLIHSERLAAMGELVAGITHEIKNPLTGILGFTELLKVNFQDKDTESKQLLNGLITSVTHLQNVVKNFLSFAKKTPPEMIPLDVNHAILDALALTGHDIRKRNIITETMLSAELPQIKGDHNQLIQVFTNMLMNAEQAMPGGGTLKITSNSKDEKVIIKIEDSGVGISKENLENIFKPFFTTKESRGTGLGLSVSHSIVEAHHGLVKVDSEVGKGTSFTLQFPAYRPGISK